MSAKASPWQNGGQESYYGKLKLEMDNLNAYESFEHLLEAIHHQIWYYNHERIHTALKTSPVLFKRRYELLKQNPHSLSSNSEEKECES